MASAEVPTHEIVRGWLRAALGAASAEMRTPGRPVGGGWARLGVIDTSARRLEGRPLRGVRPACEHVFVRWSNLTLDDTEQAHLPGHRDPAAVRRFDAPEALDMRFYEIHARSALNRVPKASQMPFRWTINPYRGCSHACVYCFARPTHTYLGFDAGRDFEREIVVKVNAPELVRAELGRPSWKGEHVAMGTNTDPYQWVESRYRLMPGIWEAMRDARNPCSILTKSPLVLRDLDLLREIAAVTDVHANLSIPTLDAKAWRATEPHTPHPRARLEAVAELNRAGIPTGVLVAPLMPGINDAPEQVEPLLEAAIEAGATGIGGIALHLRGEVRGIFLDFVREQHPELIGRYEELYARGAYAPTAERRRLAGLLRRPGTPPPSRFRVDPAMREQAHNIPNSRDFGQASLF
jgi:DNA repair photolyase